MPTSIRPTLFALPMIGWKEFARLPKLNIGPLIAKIDTGARTAALHADEIEIRGERVRFVINEQGKRHIHFAPLISEKRVKSSNGMVEMRAVIRSEIIIGQHSLDAEITLTDRTDMVVPMLLGRATIRGSFLVHPGRTFILSKQKKKRP
jgi:hypothetical protein